MDFDGLSKFLGQVGYLAHRLEEFTFELQGTVDQMRKDDDPEPVEQEPIVGYVSDKGKLDYIIKNHPTIKTLADVLNEDANLRAQLLDNKDWLEDAYKATLNHVRLVGESESLDIEWD